tara:strand:- start:1324 stop:1620 length:297 start_codon:yes stop_codon:yes gene_type:complete
MSEKLNGGEPFFTRAGRVFWKWYHKPIRFSSGSGKLIIPDALKNKLVEGQEILLAWKTKEELEEILQNYDLYDGVNKIIIGIPTKNIIPKRNKKKKEN